MKYNKKIKIFLFGLIFLCFGVVGINRVLADVGIYIDATLSNPSDEAIYVDANGSTAGDLILMESNSAEKFAVDVLGNLEVSGALTGSSICLDDDCKVSKNGLSGGSFTWENSGLDVYTTESIGIGIDTSPSYGLLVNGATNADSLCISGDCITSWEGVNEITDFDFLQSDEASFGSNLVSVKASKDYVYVVEDDVLRKYKNSRGRLEEVANFSGGNLNDFSQVAVSDGQPSLAAVVSGEITAEDNDNLYRAFRVDVQGDYAYILTLGGGGINNFGIVNISNPSNLTYVAGLQFYASLYDIKVKGNYAYISALYGEESRYYRRLYIIDISDPANPVLASELSMPSLPYVNATDLTIYNYFDIEIDNTGNYAYFPGVYKFGIVDISDPTNPVLDNVLDFFPNETLYCVVRGNYAYIATRGAFATNCGGGAGTFFSVDISDSKNPVVEDALTCAEFGGYRQNLPGIHMHPSDDYIYTSGYIIDISNPTNLSVQADANLVANKMAIDNDNLYVYEFSPTKYEVYSISNPISPVLIGNSWWQSHEFDTYLTDIDIYNGYMFTTNLTVLGSVEENNNLKIIELISGPDQEYVYLAGYNALYGFASDHDSLALIDTEENGSMGASNFSGDGLILAKGDCIYKSVDRVVAGGDYIISVSVDDGVIGAWKDICDGGNVKLEGASGMAIDGNY